MRLFVVVAACVLQPVYGFSSKDPAKFLRVAAHPELMFVQDTEASFNQVPGACMGRRTWLACCLHAILPVLHVAVQTGEAG